MTIPHWTSDDSEIPDPFGYGERAVEFLRRLKHPKNPARGHPFQLDRWQERIVRRIYGPRHDDGRRIVETVLLLLPRGNRKTSLAAALSLLHTIGPERLPGGEVIFAAADKKQSAIGFREALSIVRADPRLAKVVRVSDAVNSTKRITYKKDGTFLETLSSDAETQHGRTPTLAFVDEIHAFKKRDLWEAIRSGLPKTNGSLLIIATTAGRGQDNLAYELVEYARKVAKGEIDNPAFLPILFEAAPDADWQSEDVWRAVNPGLEHGYPSIEGLRRLAIEAKDRPGDRDAFKQFHLNVWLDSSLSPFIDMSVYDDGADPIDIAALEGRQCWLGVDMAATTDLAAVVACFRDEDDGYTVLPYFFCPVDQLRQKGEIDRAPYVRWAEEGLITATDGNVIDYRAVESCIRSLNEKYRIAEIGFDRAYAQPVMAPLLEDGFPVVTLQLGWITQSPALAKLERAIVSRKFRHGGHPVLRHHFANVSIQTDSNANRTMHKGRSTGRIDGAFATWMALERAAAGTTGMSVYENVAARPEGLLVF